MTDARVREAIEDIWDRDLIHVRADGAIVYDSRIARQWPGLDVDRLTLCVSDNVYNDVEIDWSAVEAEYLERG